MSHAPTGEPDFDFWEFVSCAVCHLPYVPDNGGPPQVPFWLTECGHVICNGHLKADQSCMNCGAQNIQVVPLQQDMDPILSDVFRSIPHVLDSVANAAKFQLGTLAALTRHYRNKCMQQRNLIQRLKAELEQRNAREWYQQEEPTEFLNLNGKRSLSQIPRPTTAAPASLSPRSLTGPNRLTLPPEEHRQPRFPTVAGSRTSEISQQRAFNGGVDTSAQSFSDPAHDRPGTNLAAQYAYNPPPTSEHHVVAGLSHEQQAPTRMAQAKRQVAPSQQQLVTSRSKFKPAGDVQHAQIQHVQRQRQTQRQGALDQMHMPPPPTPQVRMQKVPHAPQQQGVVSFRAPHGIVATAVSSSSRPHHFTVPATPGGGPQRFALEGTGGGPSGIRGQGVAQTPIHRRAGGVDGAQRRPFMPG